jgi:SAM-dependent methyltransferase
MTAATSRPRGARAAAGLPPYHDYQSAFHDAFRAELYGAIDRLPLPPGARVLDAPCGDGFYTRRLAERAGREGRLTAVDLSDTYLAATAGALAGLSGGAAVECTKADVYRLPFPDGAFDLAWCAQSLISLDDAAAALRELARVVRPGGAVAVLESDEAHHVLLPWPVGLELALHRALLLASQRRYGSRAKLAPARRVPRLMRDAGLRGRRKITVAADRSAPWGEAEARFLRLYLEFLEDLVRPHLGAAEHEALLRLARPDSRDGLFARRDADLTCLSVIHVARRPLAG